MSAFDNVLARGSTVISESELARLKREGDAAASRFRRSVETPEQRRERIAAEDATERERRDEQRRRLVAVWDEQDRLARETHAARREQERIERVTAEAETLRQQARAAFLRTPGSTESGFEAAWPELLRRYQVEEALANLGSLTERLKQEFHAMHRGAPTLFEHAVAVDAVDVRDEG